MASVSNYWEMNMKCISNVSLCLCKKGYFFDYFDNLCKHKNYELKSKLSNQLVLINSILILIV